MSAIESLEIIVEVDISSALAKLEDLQDELRQLAQSVEKVDATADLDIPARLEHIDDELARMKAKLEAFERANNLNLDVNPRTSDLAATLRAAQVDLPTADLRDVAGMGGGRDTRGLTGLMGSLADSMGDLRESVGQFDLRMSDMHNMLARLLPLLAVFIGTIPAVATALVGLATAAVAAAAGLAAIAGFGALGIGLVQGEFDSQRLSDVMSDIRDDFIDAFAPLAERLEPIVMGAVDGLTMFFEEIAARGGALMELTDEAQAFGQFMIDWFPNVLSAMAATVEALGPVFADLASYLREATILRTITELTLDAMPAVEQFIGILRRAIPTIVELSIGFTQVANVIMTVVGGFFSLLSVLPISNEAFGAMIATVLTAASVFAILNSQMLAVAFQALVGLGVKLIAGAAALAGYSKAAVAATIATSTLYSALVALLTLTGIGAILAALSVGAGALANRFGDAASNIESTTSALKRFDSVANRTEGNFNPYSGQNAPAARRSTNPSGGNTVNIETTGDRQQDSSNARYASFRLGRTTGSNN